jgi:hypothetical protein
MPPIENPLAESDFNDAVAVNLYLFERRREVDDLKAHALMVADALGTRRAAEAESEFFTAEAEEYLRRTSSGALGDI